VAKDEAQWPALRQVTPTNFIAGPLGASVSHSDKMLYICKKA